MQVQAESGPSLDWHQWDLKHLLFGHLTLSLSFFFSPPSTWSCDMLITCTKSRDRQTAAAADNRSSDLEMTGDNTN